MIASTVVEAQGINTGFINNAGVNMVCVQSESEGTGIQSESEGTGSINSESEGTGSIQSESEGTGIQSESEGTGINMVCHPL